MLTLIYDFNFSFMQIKEITNYLEDIAPLQYAESFDNVGLLVGNYSDEVTGVLVTLDTLEETVDEAIAKNCNLIVSFHPIIFTGLKKINGNSYVERVVLKAIKNNIAIYATHTALDNSKNGVSAKMAAVLHLKNTKILLPKKGIVKKLTTYVPKEYKEKLKQSLFKAGAGSLGNYSNCSFVIPGTSTFRGNENATPFLGNKEKNYANEEIELTVYFERKYELKIVKALKTNHPYEEVSYDVITTDNEYQNIGMGVIGELDEELSEHAFLEILKTKMKIACIRHSCLLNKKIKKVAVLGGSGSFAISNAIKANADVYVSADFKYHDFFTAEKKILLADIGHYESEQFTKNLLVDYLTKKFTNFAIILSEKNTNPIYYS